MRRATRSTLSPKIDVLALYSYEAYSKNGMTAPEMEDKIVKVYDSVNIAMSDSGINLVINLRHVALVSPGVEHARQHGN